MNRLTVALPLVRRTLRSAAKLHRLRRLRQLQRIVGRPASRILATALRIALPAVWVLDSDSTAGKGSLEGLSKASADLLEDLWLANAASDLLDLNGDMVASFRQLDERVPFSQAPQELVPRTVV